MSYNKLVLPITLGLSLVTVTAAVVYYIFKKDDDESNAKSVKTSRVNVIEISVPKSIVAALIGRGGSNIKEVEKKTGALIHFKKFSDKDYDVCIIRGRSQATQLAETMVHEFIKNQPVIVDDSMLVPNWSCGRIIGTGASNVSDIMHRSGAKIKIEGEKGGEANQMRVVSLRGTNEQIQVAKGLVEKCVAQEKCRREIEQSKRSPRHATPPAASPTPDEATGDTNKNYKYKKSENNGSAIEVYVSAVSSPSRFWVQFVGPQVAQLDELVEHMSEYYGNKDNRELHALSEVSIGQVVAAVFRHDGRWYRARVHDIRPNEFDNTKQVADVFFVDYGDSEYVAVHELCELRADLLRLRFQAMECFLAGVRPAGKEEEVVAVTAAGQKWERWSPQAVERFEELTQVARWKPLVSRTCTYKKTATAEGEKEREIPGIKLFDVTDEGELDIGGVLVSEGWAVVAPPSPRGSPGPSAPHAASTPFGDLGNSKVLGMLAGVAGESNDGVSVGGARCSSVPKDHKDDRTNADTDLRTQMQMFKDNERMTSSTSLSSGLEKSDRIQSVCNLELNPASAHNGTHSDALLTAERTSNSDNPTLRPIPTTLRDELKANINRIDSHHNNLELLGKHD